MICISRDCPYYHKCARAFPNSTENGTVEQLLSWGSGATFPDGYVFEQNVCGPRGNWGMFMPLKGDTNEVIQEEGN